MYRFTSELPKEEYDNFILNYSMAHKPITGLISKVIGVTSIVAYIKMIL